MRVTSIMSLALMIVIVFRPCAVTSIVSLAVNAQCCTNNVQFDGDLEDNPIFSDDKGARNLSECLRDCSLTSDVNDRPCVAIEWRDGGSALSSTESRACDFAWACDYTKAWSDGSVFLLRATAEGCASGYFAQTGDVPGFGSVQGSGGGLYVSSCDECASLCDSFSECQSYECSPTTLRCSLNDVADPSEGALQDYVFCTKTTTDPTSSPSTSLPSNSPTTFVPTTKFPTTSTPSISTTAPVSASRMTLSALSISLIIAGVAVLCFCCVGLFRCYKMNHSNSLAGFEDSSEDEDEAAVVENDSEEMKDNAVENECEDEHEEEEKDSLIKTDHYNTNVTRYDTANSSLRYADAMPAKQTDTGTAGYSVTTPGTPSTNPFNAESIHSDAGSNAEHEVQMSEVDRNVSLPELPLSAPKEELL